MVARHSRWWRGVVVGGDSAARRRPTINALVAFALAGMAAAAVPSSAAASRISAPDTSEPEWQGTLTVSQLLAVGAAIPNGTVAVEQVLRSGQPLDFTDDGDYAYLATLLHIEHGFYELYRLYTWQGEPKSDIEVGQRWEATPGYSTSACYPGYETCANARFDALPLGVYLVSGPGFDSFLVTMPYLLPGDAGWDWAPVVFPKPHESDTAAAEYDWSLTKKVRAHCAAGAACEPWGDSLHVAGLAPGANVWADYQITVGATRVGDGASAQGSDTRYNQLWDSYPELAQTYARRVPVVECIADGAPRANCLQLDADQVIANPATDGVSTFTYTVNITDDRVEFGISRNIAILVDPAYNDDAQVTVSYNDDGAPPPSPSPSPSPSSSQPSSPGPADPGDGYPGGGADPAPPGRVRALAQRLTRTGALPAALAVAAAAALALGAAAKRPRRNHCRCDCAE